MNRRRIEGSLRASSDRVEAIHKIGDATQPKNEMYHSNSKCFGRKRSKQQKVGSLPLSLRVNL
jgi:hypothetical protein